MTVTLEEAQQSLPALIAGLKPGDELIITQNAKAVAQVLPVGAQLPEPRFGSCQGKLTILSDDDEHLLDFHEFME